MKVEIEILEDQVELLKKIQDLPKVIDDYLGNLPQSFNADLNGMKDNAFNLEVECKRWIYETCILQTRLNEVLDGLKVISKDDMVLTDYTD
jgi:hypothetical protein